MLSKSRFLAGLQCPLRLWNQCFRPELATKPSPSQQAIFEMGHEVGLLAHKLYPDGVNITEDYLHHREAVKTTETAMADGTVPAIFEGAFVHDDVRIRVDILERLNGQNWNLIEVKASTSVKEVHMIDAAIQYYVLTRVGLEIDRVGIMHLCKKYAYNGVKIVINELFNFEDLTDYVQGRQRLIVKELESLKAVLLLESPPDISPARHCLSPYKCEFLERCTEVNPKFGVTGLSNGRKQRDS